MAAIHPHWSQEDVLTMLCTLNFRIQDIRSEALRNPREGFLVASRLISDAIGDGCSPSRVERKLRQLWATCGKPEGDRNPYELCLYGAFPKTLPGIDAELFSAVASNLEQKQRQAEVLAASRGPDRLADAQIRRSRRNASKRDGDPTCCRCGFTHNILWVRCDKCPTWQHAYCYYNTEDAAQIPRVHVCDDCSLDSKELSMQQMMGQLDIRSGILDENKVRQLLQRQLRSDETSTINQNNHIERFGLSIEKDVMWGPEDEEISNHLLIIRSRLLYVANSLESELELSKETTTKIANPDTLDLIYTVLGQHDQEIWLRDEFLDPAKHRPKRRQFLRAILAAAISKWVFGDEDGHTRDSEDSILLFHYQDEIFTKHEMSVLESLHRRAYIQMMKNESPLQKLMANEAEELTDRWFEAILPATTASQRHPPIGIHEWMASDPQGEIRRENLTHAFNVALKLKRWLPLAQKCFEFFTPPPNSSPQEGHAMKLDEETTGRDEVVKFCLVPGVIEYPLDMFLSPISGPCALFGRKNLVRATDDQRKAGRVISPAVVVTLT